MAPSTTRLLMELLGWILEMGTWAVNLGGNLGQGVAIRGVAGGSGMCG